MYNITKKTVDAVQNALETYIPTYKAELESEVGTTLPDIVMYKKGFYNPFDLFDYPAILIKADTRAYNTMVDSVTVDVLFVMMQKGDAETMNAYGMYWADVLTNIFVGQSKLGADALDTTISSVEHYVGTDRYLVDITLIIERSERGTRQFS
jgi:hypothetical protein